MTDMFDEMPERPEEPVLDLGTVESVDDEPGINLDFAGDDVADGEESGIDLNFETEEEAAESAEAAAEAAEIANDAGALAEKAMADLHEKLISQPGDWYVVHTYSGMENRVKQNLENRAKTLNMEDYIFEVVVPIEQVDEIRGNQKKTVNRNRLQGYVLVRMELTDESWSAVRHTPSVTGFVGMGQQPISISIEDVERQLGPSVIAQATAELTGKPVKRKVEAVDYEVGDTVQLEEGVFDGMQATIQEINPASKKLKVVVEFMGRETPMEVAFGSVKKI